ncbi:MAG: hypothetical protein AAGD25_39020 [Cyanobacteria bacterium P01_F01_bin.150]
MFSFAMPVASRIEPIRISGNHNAFGVRLCRAFGVRHTHTTHQSPKSKDAKHNNEAVGFIINCVAIMLTFYRLIAPHLHRKLRSPLSNPLSNSIMYCFGLIGTMDDAIANAPYEIS